MQHDADTLNRNMQRRGDARQRTLYLLGAAIVGLVGALVMNAVGFF